MDYIFDLEEETRLRWECHSIIEKLIEDLKINESELDGRLFGLGRKIRKQPREEWDKYFCYRFGCYYY